MCALLTVCVCPTEGTLCCRVLLILTLKRLRDVTLLKSHYSLHLIDAFGIFSEVLKKRSTFLIEQNGAVTCVNVAGHTYR